MTSCNYNALTMLAVVAAPFLAWLGFKILSEAVSSIKSIELPRINLDWMNVAVPVAALIAIAFFMLHTLPKKVEIVDCKTGQRVTSFAYNMGGCSVKKG